MQLWAGENIINDMGGTADPVGRVIQAFPTKFNILGLSLELEK